MNQRKESIFLVFVAIVLAAGVAFETLSGDVEPGSASTVAGDRFSSRAVFCPPAVGGPESTTRVVVGSATGEDITAALLPAGPEPVDVPADQIILGRARNGNPIQVVGYGTRVAASSVTSSTRPSDGVGAARCSTEASERWYFAAGSASIDADERILIYNPFPDEAVVRAALFTPGGERTKTSLTDVAIPAGEWRTISVNEAIQVKRSIAVEVVAKRGRVVAWREMFLSGRGVPTGLDYTLGAPEAADRWFFADGAVGEGVTETISVLNPSDEEATINVILATPTETLTPPDLVEFPVPPRSQQVIDLEEFTGAPKKGTAAVSAAIAVSSGPSVVVERTLVYDGGELSGTSSEIGATVTSTRWFAGPAALSPSSDLIAVFNPSSQDATVDIALLRRGAAPLTPADLEGLMVPAGSRIKIPIGSFGGGTPLAALVTADTGVVVERFSFSGGANDVSSLIGYPMDPISE